MIGDYLRLAAATVVVLCPGWLVARRLGLRSASAGLAFALGTFFVAWAIVFTVHAAIWLAATIVAVIGAAAFVTRWFPPGRREGFQRREHVTRRFVLARRGVVAAGVVLGIALWPVAGAVTGDGIFHEGRVRKLVDLGNLHLRTVDEFKDGGLHPGYAFPLWHGFLALVSAVSGLDPYVVVDHESSLLVPLAMLVVWESGVAVFGRVGGGFTVLAATLGLYCFAAGHGGSYVTLALPATVARQLLIPAVYALFFWFVRSGRRPGLVALGVLFGGLCLIHSTYALFGLIPLAAYAALRPREWRRTSAAFAAMLAPAIAVYAWLKPLVDETLTHNPDAASVCDSLLHFGGQLVVSSAVRSACAEVSHHTGHVTVASLEHYRLAAEVVGRSGAVAVAALALVPLAGFAARRSWGAFVLGGSIVVLALMLVPFLFMHFSDEVTVSQARRAAGFVPFAFAFAGGLALLARSFLVLPVALAAGIVIEERWPGDFAAGTHGGPGLVTWLALVGGAVALVLGLVFARAPVRERHGLAAVAAALFVLPVAIHGFERWSALTPTDPNALPAELRAELARLPARTVVWANSTVSYEIEGDFPLYVADAPLAHVAHTTANDPQQRIDAYNSWVQTRNPAIPRRYGATWAVVKVGKKGATHYRLYRLSA